MANAQAGTILRHIRQLVGAPAERQVPDSELLRRFAGQRDEAAFAALVRRHGGLVWSICRNVLGHEQDAEDAFQATFLVLARKAASLCRGEALAGWLYGVASRTARKARAVSARRRRREREALTMRRNADTELALRELQAILDEEVGRLPAKYRAPFVLHCLQGKTKPEAARELGWKEGTVSSRLAQARRLLQQRLSRRGVALSAALAAAAVARGTASATVPALLAKATTEAALSFSAGEAAAAGSAQAVALAKGVIQAMLVTKLKAVVPVLVTLGLLVVSAGLAAHQLAGPEPAAQPPAAPEPAAEAAEQPAASAEKQGRDRNGDPLPEHSVARLGSLSHFRPGLRVNHAAFSPDRKTIALASQRAVTIWDLATAKEVHRFQAPGFTVLMENSAVAFSPDGTLLAAASSTAMTVHLWGVSTKKELHAFRHGDWVAHLAFAPDGKMLATTASGANENSIYLWDVATGRKLHQFNGPGTNYDKAFTSIAFSPDGRTLASGSYDSVIRLWEVDTGKESRQLKSPPIPGYRGVVGTMAFSLDGKLLVSAHGDGLIRFWDPQTGKKLRELKGHEDGVVSVVLSPDGKMLASGGGDHSIRLWDLDSGKPLRQIVGQGQRYGVYSLAFSPDGLTLLSWGGLNTVRFWDVAAGKELRRTPGHQSDVARVQFSSDGRQLYSWGQDRTLRLWDLKRGAERCLSVGTNWGTDDQAVSFSPDGKILALATAESMIDLWEVATGRLLRKLKGHRQWVSTAAFSPDGRLLASGSSWDRTIRLWDLAIGKQVKEWEAIRKGDENDDEIRALTWSPDGKVLASGGNRRAIHLWDVAAGKELRHFNGHADGPFPTQQPRPVCIAFAPDGQIVASVRHNDPVIRLWKADTGKELRRLPWPVAEPFVGVFAVAFSPTGRTLAVSRLDGTITIWEVATGRQVREFRGHRGEVSCLAFSPDGRRIASGSIDSTIVVWDLTDRSDAGQQVELSPKNLEKLWSDLADEDGEKAYRAVWRLAAVPGQAIPFLRDHLKPATTVDAQRIARLIANLDSSRFTDRENASQELEKLAELAAPALRKVLAGKSSAEVQRRVQQLLEKVDGAVMAPETLRAVRTIEILEHIGTPEAQEVLKSLAKGAPEARLTQEAKASLDRLAKRPTSDRR